MALLREALAEVSARFNMDVELQNAIARHEQKIFYNHLEQSKDFLQARIKHFTGRENLDGWIVCGSGLASLPDSKDIKVIDSIQVEEIPHWFAPQAPGHGKEIIIADIKGQIVGIQTGRAHIYDTDYSPRQLKMITAPLIVAKGLGINWLITTNAAGVLDKGKIFENGGQTEKIKVGDVVVDIDYVNQHGVNPLIGLNDPRLGTRFPSKNNVADPMIYSRLEKFIPEDRLHLGIYTLASNAPFYEGRGDLVRGMYQELKEQNPDLVEAFGMSLAMDAMVMQHYNEIPVDRNGFDRQVHWIGLTAATNVIPQIEAPTKESLRNAVMRNPNPTNEEDVLSGGKVAEKLLIPAVVDLCKSFTDEPLPLFGNDKSLRLF